MIYRGDLFDVLPTLYAESVDACVTDPPYGLEFMGKEWDRLGAVVQEQRRDTPAWTNGSGVLVSGAAGPFGGGGQRVRYGTSAQSAQVWHKRWAVEVFRVMKPGAYVLAFGGTRTFHRMTCAIEDAGFEIRDCLAWLFGSGFPKSLNIGDGLGTALKPAHEPIVLARKPFNGGVRANVERFGTGALNIDGCRIDARGESWQREPGTVRPNDSIGTFKTGARSVVQHDLGRWPANVVLDEIAAAALDEQSGELNSGSAHLLRRGATTGSGIGYGSGSVGHDASDATYGDSGGASRFYYVAKPSREERDMGCYDLPARSGGEATDRVEGSAGVQSPRAGAGRTGGARNIHPTVKPVELMRWLVRLVTPPNGVVLDPFMGSGTTGMACAYEQRRFIGIEREAEYIAIAERRIAAVAPLFAVDGPSVEAAEASEPSRS